MSFENSHEINESITRKRSITDAEYAAVINFILSLRRDYSYARKITHGSTVVEIAGNGVNELAKDLEEATCHCGNKFRFAFVSTGGLYYLVMLRNNKLIKDNSLITVIQPIEDGVKFVSTVPGKLGAAKGLTMGSFMSMLPADATYSAILVFDDEKFS